MRKKSNTTIIILNEDQQRRIANIYRKLELHNNLQNQNTEQEASAQQDEDKTRVINLTENPYLHAA